MLLYLCDAESGSSGSPIVKTLKPDSTSKDKNNHNRYVIGLHRGDLEVSNKNYNYGSTMTAIINDIKAQITSNPDLCPKYIGALLLLSY